MFRSKKHHPLQFHKNFPASIVNHIVHTVNIYDGKMIRRLLNVQQKIQDCHIVYMAHVSEHPQYVPSAMNERYAYLVQIFFSNQISLKPN